MSTLLRLGTGVSQPRRSLASVVVALVCANLCLAEVKVTDFGKTADGTPVEEFTITNSNGVKVKLISRGATLAEWHVPDKNGKVGRRRLRLRRRRRLRIARTTATSAPRPAASPTASPRQVHARRQRIHARHERRPQHLHGGVKRSLDKVVWDGTPFENRTRAKASSSLTPAPTAKKAIPGKLDMTGHLHAHRQERASHRLRRDDRQATPHQPDEPRLLQSLRRWFADDQRPRADAHRRPATRPSTTR